MTEGSVQPESWDPAPDDDGDEQVKIARLLRWVGFFLVWPGVSIAAAFLIFEDASEHAGHIALSLAFSLVGAFLALSARRIAVKYA